MNNKLYNSLCLTVLIAIASTANASSLLNSDCCPCNGFYAGINGGAIFTKGEISANSSADFVTFFEPNNQLVSSQKVDVADNEGGGSIYLGYSQLLNCSRFFLAGEIFANSYKRNPVLNNFVLSSQPTDDEYYAFLNTATTARLKNAEYGFDLRPGYFFNNHTALYGRVGIAFNELTLTSNQTFSFTDIGSTPLPFVTTNSILSQSKTDNLEALRLGLGLESYLCKNLALTADYIYTRYNSVNLKGQANVTTIITRDEEDGEETTTNVTPDGLTNQSSAKLSTQTVTLGIKYYFG